MSRLPVSALLSYMHTIDVFVLNKCLSADLVCVRGHLYIDSVQESDPG